LPPTTDLIILFHGIGASGAQMMPLASAWKTSLRTARFVTPDAPFGKAVGRSRLWFQVDGNQLRPDRLAEIRDAFDRMIDQIINREEYSEALDRVAFVGVSQGAIVALDAVAAGRWKVGAIIGYSGLFPPLPPPGKKRLVSKLI
jgi:phospholipase/carboxylesterase